ncbi:hypothetical protein HS99_0017695 [Kitasatospora aureofaciens]|uniref:Uncharacterized protein n=1 Tax=Kitasatospora aureofaciens TaxID=1894 RepID=A0A1E7NE29_KITAU|nr:hypothetical protein B6264_29950 [Kitasatospora aureofaciens]OEV38949.1 hypothetical protein HS99_0017695 [Kitasatospora aureofaciens]
MNVVSAAGGGLHGVCFRDDFLVQAEVGQVLEAVAAALEDEPVTGGGDAGACCGGGGQEVGCLLVAAHVTEDQGQYVLSVATIARNRLGGDCGPGLALRFLQTALHAERLRQKGACRADQRARPVRSDLQDSA